MAATARPPPPIDVEASLLSRKMRSLSTHDMQLPPTPTSAIAPPPIPTLTAPQRFPLYLPSCPPHIYKPRSQSLELLVGDEDLRDVPQAFLRDMLAHLGSIFASSSSSARPPPQIAAMYIRGLPEMSQFVSARADLVDWRAQPGTLPAFAAAAAAKESLPVVALSLPDREAFELMHGWVYGTLAKSEIWEELVYGSGAASSDGEDDNDDEMSDEEDLDVGTRLAKIAALWRTAVALECADEELWEAMGKAWETVVEEVLCGERRNETDEEDEASEDEEMEEGEEGEGGAFSP
ncbi:hypothetical protein JCM10213v2_008906 [Rhodosporidiobolus nylandii]